MKHLFSALFAIMPLVLFTNCNKDDESSANKPFTITTNNNPSAGDILVAPFTSGNSTGKLYILDQNGNILKEKTTDALAINFERWLIDGKVRYSYLLEDKNGYHIPDFASYIPGYYVLTDENFNEITIVRLLPHGSIATDKQNLLDAHDFIVIADDHFLTMAYYEKYVHNIPDSLHPSSVVKVIAPVIQEVKDGQVIWQWDGTDYPDLYANSIEGNDYQDSSVIHDYAHMNSMFIDQSDNNIICSFRNLDQIIKINRQNGQIIWKFGGKNSDFLLSENERFLRQHNATISEGKLLLFDNGEVKQRAYSRILEFQLDEANKTVLNFSSFNVPGAFAQYMGSVTKNSKQNTYFIGGGSAKYLVEVNYLTGEKIFEMQLKENSYRSFKYYQ
jgi:arylsulfate sulfotransferase